MIPFQWSSTQTLRGRANCSGNTQMSARRDEADHEGKLHEAECRPRSDHVTIMNAAYYVSSRLSEQLFRYPCLLRVQSGDSAEQNCQSCFGIYLGSCPFDDLRKTVAFSHFSGDNS